MILPIFTLLSPSNLISNFLGSHSTTFLLKQSNIAWYLVRKLIPNITSNSSSSKRYKSTFIPTLPTRTSKSRHTCYTKNISTEGVLISNLFSRSSIWWFKVLACDTKIKEYVALELNNTEVELHIIKKTYDYVRVVPGLTSGHSAKFFLWLGPFRSSNSTRSDLSFVLSVELIGRLWHSSWVSLSSHVWIVSSKLSWLSVVKTTP